MLLIAVKYFIEVINALRIIRIAASLRFTMVLKIVVGFHLVSEEW